MDTQHAHISNRVSKTLTSFHPLSASSSLHLSSCQHQHDHPHRLLSKQGKSTWGKSTWGVKVGKVKSSQVKSSQVKSSQVKSSQVKSSQVMEDTCGKLLRPLNRGADWQHGAAQSTHSAQCAFVDVFLLCHFDGGLIVLLEMVTLPQAPRHRPLQQRMQLIIVILHVITTNVTVTMTVRYSATLGQAPFPATHAAHHSHFEERKQT